MLTRLRNWLRTSPHIHVRQHSPTTTRELVDLLDRFLYGEMLYELEWDDFISWANANPNIEQIRLRILESERLIFSKAQKDRQQGLELIVNERNRAAALAGVDARDPPPLK